MKNGREIRGASIRSCIRANGTGMLTFGWRDEIKKKLSFVSDREFNSESNGIKMGRIGLLELELKSFENVNLLVRKKVRSSAHQVHFGVSYFITKDSLSCWTQ